jgi:hypothetical protein
MKFMRILRIWFKNAAAVVCKRWILRSALWILWLDTPPERKYPSVVTERLYRVSIRKLYPTSQLLHISWVVPSGNLLHSYWKWPLYSWFTHWKWVIFHSYVSLPKGRPGKSLHLSSNRLVQAQGDFMWFPSVYGWLSLRCEKHIFDKMSCKNSSWLFT